jgi:hypothetical protein
MEINPMTDITDNASEREREFDYDIDDLAEAIARKAIEGYEPVPHRIVKELGRNTNMRDSLDLVGDVTDRDTLFLHIVEAACERIDEWNEANGGLWWPTTKPDAP